MISFRQETLESFIIWMCNAQETVDWDNGLCGLHFYLNKIEIVKAQDNDTFSFNYMNMTYYDQLVVRYEYTQQVQEVAALSFYFMKRNWIGNNSSEEETAINEGIHVACCDQSMVILTHALPSQEVIFIIQ